MKLILLSTLVLFSTQVFAGKVDDGVIAKIAINKDIGDIVFIYTNEAKNIDPECQSNQSWRYVMEVKTDLEKTMFSMLLAAKSSGAKVRLNGNSLCDTFGSIETLRYVEIKP